MERRTAALLVYLHRLPRWTLPIGLATFMVAGLAITGPVGSALLLVLALFLGWFAFLSWPSLGTPGRLLRIAVLAILVAVAISRLTS